MVIHYFSLAYSNRFLSDAGFLPFFVFFKGKNPFQPFIVDFFTIAISSSTLSDIDKSSSRRRLICSCCSCSPLFFRTFRYRTKASFKEKSSKYFPGGAVYIYSPRIISLYPRYTGVGLFISNGIEESSLWRFSPRSSSPIQFTCYLYIAKISRTLIIESIGMF